MRRVLAVLALVPVVGWTALAGAPAATRLDSALEILAALRAGGKVRAVFHYKNMRLVDADGQPEKAPDAIGGMELEPFEYFAAGSVGNDVGFLSASHAQLIRHPRYGYVTNYVKVTVEDTGAVHILAQYLDPHTDEVLMDETFHTEIADGVNKGAAFFFLVE
jgi:hypothetical protein